MGQFKPMSSSSENKKKLHCLSGENTRAVQSYGIRLPHSFRTPLCISDQLVIPTRQHKFRYFLIQFSPTVKHTDELCSSGSRLATGQPFLEFFLILRSSMSYEEGYVLASRVFLQGISGLFGWTVLLDRKADG